MEGIQCTESTNLILFLPGMVVLDERNHSKIVATHPYCNADIAMLDPELTVKLPKAITASTAMDALTHAIEGVTSTSRQPMSDAMGLHAIHLISTYLPVAVKEPKNLDARGNLLIASTLAGMCFINSMTGGVHATAHALGGKYGIPHGLANAVMLPVIMDFNAQEEPERYLMVADALNIPVNGQAASQVAAAAVQAVRDLKAQVGLNQTLKDLNVPDDPEKLDWERSISWYCMTTPRTAPIAASGWTPATDGLKPDLASLKKTRIWS